MKSRQGGDAVGQPSGSVMLEKGELRDIREAGGRSGNHKSRIVDHNSGHKAQNDEQFVRTTSHSPFQPGRATATNFNRAVGGNHHIMAAGDSSQN